MQRQKTPNLRVQNYASPQRDERFLTGIMARRQHITLIAVAAIFVFMTMTYILSGGSSDSDSNDGKLDLGLSDSLLNGGSIAPKLGNATAK